MKGFLCFMFLAMMVLFANQTTTAKEKDCQTNYQNCTDMGVPCATPYIDLAIIINFETITQPASVYSILETQGAQIVIYPPDGLQSQYLFNTTIEKLKSTQIYCYYDPGWNYLI